MVVWWPLNDYFQAACSFLLVVAFLILNALMNITNKWALSIFGFRFPLLLTVCHMTFIFFALLPCMLRKSYRSRHRGSLEEQWKGLLAIGLLMAANISLNNLSLVLITLSLNQVIRSSIPVCAAVASVIIEHKIPSKSEATALVVLTLGVMMAVSEGLATSNLAGVVLCIAGTVSNAALVCTSGKLLSEKMDVLLLTFYTAPISCASLLPGFVFREGAQFMLFAADNGYGVLLVILCSSAIALLYNVVHALLIKQTSAVTVTVLGQLKVVGLIVVSAIVLDEKQLFTWKMLVGFALAMTGFGLYTQAKVVKMQLQTIPSESSDLPDHAAYSQLDSEMTSLEGPANTVHTTDDHQHEHN